MKYAIYKLEDLSNESLARKYAQLNAEAIRAIQERPLLFASQFIRSTDSWRKELENEPLACWICVAPNAKNGSLSLENGQWIGIHQLRGPLSPTEYNSFHDESLVSGPDDFCTRWKAERLYIRAGHRNVDAGSLMQQASITYLIAQTKSHLRDKLDKGTQRTAQIRVQLLAYHGSASSSMHQTSNLRIVREVTRAEDLNDIQILDQVPVGLLREDDYTRAVGIVSESIENVLVED